MRFVLVEPRSGGNVGSAARALENLGFRRLVVVAPACDPKGNEAHRMAVDAHATLEAARVVATLDEALDGAVRVVGTTRRAGKHRRPHWRLDRFEIVDSAASQTAFVFGREDRGLTDEELDRCTHLVYLPADAAYESFNLAQALLLTAYHARLALDGDPPEPADPEPRAADAAREAMYRHLGRSLDTIGFVHRDSAAPIMRRLRRLIGRALPSEREVQMLRGLARQIDWVAGRAGLNADDDDDRTG